MSQFPHVKLNHQKILKKNTKSSCLNAKKKLILNGGTKNFGYNKNIYFYDHPSRGKIK
jgi:hypothetical protein